MTRRIAIDTGGTFTDLVGLDAQTGALFVSKTPSIPSRPEEAVLNALQQSGADPAALDILLLGTTVATNALLERKGARVLYLTTAGFEDVLFIQRVNRKFHYDLTWKKPDPFAARRDSIGVRQRIDKDGRILLDLTEEEMARVGSLVREHLNGNRGDVAIAVNLLFSYANPVHEERLGEFLRRSFPDVPVSLSHKVAPIWREYERGSTTTADAYVKPIIKRFVSRTEDGLARWGYRGPFAIIKSNGGSMLSAAAKDHAVQVLLSGLAGGMIAGKYYGAQVGSNNVISLDMGGTSTDVGTVTNGEIGYTTEYQVEWGVPIAAPFMDLTTIGAGGGSLAWVDKGGFLKVGPQSAGADPGPVCYGRGGKEPTVTDANLVLGRLNPDYFLGGQMSLDLDAASARLAEFGASLGLSREGLARAILDLANENMANAIRLLTVQRGIDPREYDLVAFGGAGPLHAYDIARSAGIRRIVIPPHPGLGSAFGALLADLRVDKVWTHALRSDRVEVERIDNEFSRLAAEAVAELRSEGFSGEPLIRRSISMRYVGQNYEQDVTVPLGKITEDTIQAIFEAFHRQHEEFYGYRIGGEVIQLVHFNVSAIGPVLKPSLRVIPRRPQPRPVAMRQVCFREEEGFITCPIYRRPNFGAGTEMVGPAIVEEEDSTTLVHSGQHLTVDEHGIFVLTV
ncbi:MAG: hydantoinase/oxoprolinase family protein [Anaerolineae bacterium]|nr:hydantoinase/oxoprolinase family protein [Anaerolineae bacterium]